jgi:hypothetical protein
VWLPDYFCGQPVRSLAALGAELVFYPLTDTLQPAWDRCRGIDRPPDIVVLVHYFGVPSNASSARRFASEQRAVLVEDAAHVLRPEPGVGESGDFVVYSPHKWLAVPDGGILVIRGSAPFAAADVQAALRSHDSAHAPWLVWLAKRSAQKLPIISTIVALRNSSPARFLDDPAEGDALPPLSMSGVSRRLIARADLDTVASRRQANASALEAAMSGLFDGAVAITARGRVPYRLVLRCPDSAVASAIYSALRRRGLPVESWPDLPPEVLAHPERHSAAIGRRRSQVFLPVHQSLAPELLASTYQSALRATWSSR